MSDTILSVKDLVIKFNIGLNVKKFTAVSNVSFDLQKGHVLGVVGESGSGKTQLALSILGLNAENAIISGDINYNGINLLKLNEEGLNTYRGNHISMVLQDAMAAFNPYLSIRDQIIEPLIVHKGVTEEVAEKKALELLDAVQVPDSKNKILLYPYEFSGGMLQRVMIAMALMCNPKILIADEVTTGLDVTIQAQVLKLIYDIRKEYNMSIIFITHDIGVLSQIANEVLVMYCGNIMEYTTVEKLINNPISPYSKGLINSIPRIDNDTKELPYIEGKAPNIHNLLDGCPFASRCKIAQQKCLTRKPNLKSIGDDGHKVACFYK